jgi:hypothetical protein
MPAVVGFDALVFRGGELVAGPARTHYLNSDFDLGLRPRPRQREHPGLVRQVRELSVQAVVGADSGDSALVRAEVPEPFLEHLDKCGLAVPSLLEHPRVDPAARLRPFGWSAEAIELNAVADRPVKHPPFSTIRKVNSRSFSLELERDLAPDGPLGVMVESLAGLNSFLSDAPGSSEWVVKAEHGNAGLANRRISGSGLTAIDRRFVEQRFAEDDRMVVEPWLPRERDLCVVFDTPFDASTLRIHETFGTSDGALIGALFEPDESELAPWKEELAGMAERVASKLDDAGYFGPVCVDAFCWRDGDQSKLRSLFDLNCRLSMSDCAYRLWRRAASDRILYYRFFNRRKLALPNELHDVVAALGRRAYDPSGRRGILLASPLRLGTGDDAWQAGKLAVMLVAEKRSEVFELERWFRDRFEG